MKNKNKYSLENKIEIESVGLTIRAKDGQVKEIPLEVWQVDIIYQMLGLSVNLSDLNDYKMLPKENVDEYMAVYHDALKKIATANRNRELKEE